MSNRTAKIAKLVYRTHMGRTDQPVITLGVLAELPIDEKRWGLFVMAREIDSDIRAQLDWTSQQLLIPISDFLDKEIQAAIIARPEDVLGYLAQKFAWSLHFTQPQEVPFEAGLVENVAERFIEADRRQPMKLRRSIALKVGASKGRQINVGKDAAIKLASAAAPEFETAASTEIMFPYGRKRAGAIKEVHYCN